MVSASSEISALTAGWNTLGEEENCPGGEKMSEGKCPVLVSAASDHSVFADEHGGLWDREPTPGPGAARRGGGSWGRQPQVTLSPPEARLSEHAKRGVQFGKNIGSFYFLSASLYFSKRGAY